MLEPWWDHFNDKAMPPNRKWLPHELAARMRADGKLVDSAVSLESARSVEAHFRANYPTLLPSHQLRQQCCSAHTHLPTFLVFDGVMALML